MDTDIVVLVDDQNNVLGTAPKLATHTGNTPLHRGFSVFLFNNKGELLLQQRAAHKKTWPNVWSNSVCGHPRLDESVEDAARRRLDFELGIKQAEIHMILPTYMYKVELNGIVENEICPVMLAFSEDQPKPNPDEVQATKWITWEKWLKEIKQNPQTYSAWCVEETELLEKEPQFKNLLARQM